MCGWLVTVLRVLVGFCGPWPHSMAAWRGEGNKYINNMIPDLSGCWMTAL